MDNWESGQLQVYFDLVGTDQQKRQNFNHLIEEPTTEDILAFGNLLDQLAPTDHALDSIVRIDRTRYIA